MRRRNVLLLAISCLLMETHLVQASVIIKTVPHANVKMEFGAQHVPPHDVALLDESAKVDGTTRLGIEVPHSHNHRNVLIHKIGTYLTVVMKALAKTVAPAQNQEGKTHFDIHVDADLGENDKKDESAQVTIVHSKHGEEEKHGKGDCVKAVVILSEPEKDEKREEHKSLEKHHKDEHKKKEDVKISLHHSGEHSKGHSKQNIHHESEQKVQITKEKMEEKKEEITDPLKLQPPKDWESFKKTQAILKEKGFILQLDKSFFISKENQGKQSQKVQSLDIKQDIKLSHEGKSLSEEAMDESERNWKSLELSGADSEEVWIGTVNPTDLNNRYEPSYQTNEGPSDNFFSKAETVHMSSVNNPSKGGNQVQTTKTTAYQSGDGPIIVTTTKSVTEMPKTVNYETAKQTSAFEKLNSTEGEHDQRQLLLSTNEIPSSATKSSHYQQTSYSSDRSRSMTIVTQDSALDSSKGNTSQPVIFHVRDKMTAVSESSKAVPHSKTHDGSHEVIMRLAPATKTGVSKKAQMSDTKKIKVTKPDASEEGHKGDIDPDGTASRQESVRKLPMANIPTLIDVLQNSPPQEVQRLTQFANGGTPQETLKENSGTDSGNSPLAQTNAPDSSLSKSIKEFQLHEPNESEEDKGLVKNSEADIKSPAPSDMTFKTVRNEKSHKDSEEIHAADIAEVPSKKTTSHHYDDISKDGSEVTKESNPDAEKPISLKSIPSSLKSVDVSIGAELDMQQKDVVSEYLNDKDDQSVQKKTEDTVDHESERSKKTFHYSLKNDKEEVKADDPLITETDAVDDIGKDARAAHALALGSLPTSVEKAITVNQNIPLPHHAQVEVVPSPKKLKQPDVPDAANKGSEDLLLEKGIISPILAEDKTEQKQEGIPNEALAVDKQADVHHELKETTHSDTDSVLPSYSDSPYDILPTAASTTTPSLPEKKSISLPVYKEKELDDAHSLVSNLVEPNEEFPAGEIDRDGRIYDSRLDYNPLPGSVHQHAVMLPEMSVTTSATPLNHAIHDPNSPYIYSYYPSFYPKGVYNTENRTEEAQGLYGRPSPRVICVNADTGKVLDDTLDIGGQTNAVTKYSPEINRSNKEDDNLMLLKLLHEDIQKLKQQLKIQ